MRYIVCEGGNMTNEEIKNLAHKDICIPFTIIDKAGTEHHFEVVGFLHDGEEYVLKEEALRRCDNGGLIVKERDFDFIFQYRHQLPRKYRHSCLITGVEAPGFGPGCISILIQEGPPFNTYVDMKTWNEWCRHWLGNLWWSGMHVNSTALVIRRTKAPDENES